MSRTGQAGTREAPEGEAEAGSDTRDGDRLYAEREERFSRRREAVDRRVGRLGTARVVSFLAGLALLLAAEWTAGTASAAAAVAGGVFLLGFGLLVARHRHWRRERERLGHLVDANREARARLRRDWEALPELADEGGIDGHPYAEDLDVVGRASVLRLLNTLSTASGADRARRWLLSPAGPGAASARHDAARRLADDPDLRQEWTAAARRAGLSRSDRVEPFLEWAGEESWSDDHRGLLWTARLLPAANVALMAAHATGLTAYAWWAVGLAVALAVSGVASTRIHPVFDRLTRGEANVARHRVLLERVADLPGGADQLEAARDAVAGPPDARSALLRLERLISASDVRRNALAHFPLQLLTLWDVHLVWAMDRWRDRFGGEARRWFEAVGRVDALLAFSALAADHPDWCRPEIEPGREVLEAEGLGHPLLEPEACVTNDLTVGPPGTFLVVTGSNMSGKSTLLRAVGLAAVLAQAGAPAPARRLRIPPLEVVTSMQVEDSLSEGISEFMAELHRVRTVVETAEAGRAGGGRALYLMDEPLQGTNEAERREGLRILLRRLAESDAIGAVATHDLRVHRTPELEPAADVVHLTGEVSEGEDGPRLSFDYRVRSGPAPSTNALALMRALGLTERGDGPA